MKKLAWKFWSSALLLTTFSIYCGCQEPAAHGSGPTVSHVRTPLPPAEHAAANHADQHDLPDGQAAYAQETFVENSPEDVSTELAADLPADETSSQPQNDPAQPAAGPAPTTKPVIAPAEPPTGPDVPQFSQGLQEIVRLAQAGVSQEVMLAYVTNATQVYELDSEAIVYLNDLGISSEVMMAMIEADNSPEAEELRKKALALQSMPEDIPPPQPGTEIYPDTSDPSNRVQSPRIPENLAGANVAGNPYDGTAVAAAPAQPEAPVETYQPAPNEQLPSEVAPYYEPLNPYGRWYYTPEYGHVWQPTVAVVNYNWRPYADHGRWLWSSSGWYWYSDYSWGWAPFHYGRWCQYPGVGWIWRPGLTWGPSWVSWRYTKYYAGWAPLPPRCDYVSGVGLYYNGVSVGASFGFGLGLSAYTFIPINRFCDRRPYHYYVGHHHAKTIYKDSTVINQYFFGDNNQVVNHGIGLDRVSRLTRRDIQRVSINQAPAAPGNYSRLEQYNAGDNTLTVRTPPPIRESYARSRQASDRNPASPDQRGSRGTAKTVGTAEGGKGAPTRSSVAARQSQISAEGRNDSSLSSRSGRNTTVLPPLGRSSRTINRSAVRGSDATATAPSSAQNPSANRSSSDGSQTLARPQFSRPSRTDAGNTGGPAATNPNLRGRVQTPADSMRIQTSRPTPQSRTFRVYPDGNSQSSSRLGIYSPGDNSRSTGNRPIVVSPTPSGNAPDTRGQTADTYTRPSPRVIPPDVSTRRNTITTQPDNRYNRQSVPTFQPPPTSVPRSLTPPRNIGPPRNAVPSRNTGPSRQVVPSRNTAPTRQVAPPPSRRPSRPNVNRSPAVRARPSAPRTRPRVSTPSRGNSQSSGVTRGGGNNRGSRGGRGNPR